MERVRGSENEVVQAGKSEDREKKNKTKQKNQMVRKAVAFRSLAERWKTKCISQTPLQLSSAHDLASPEQLHLGQICRQKRGQAPLPFSGQWEGAWGAEGPRAEATWSTYCWDDLWPGHAVLQPSPWSRQQRPDSMSSDNGVVPGQHLGWWQAESPASWSCWKW